jgi:hypothetical protein
MHPRMGGHRLLSGRIGTTLRAILAATSLPFAPPLFAASRVRWGP